MLTVVGARPAVFSNWHNLPKQGLSLTERLIFIGRRECRTELSKISFSYYLIFAHICYFVILDHSWGGDFPLAHLPHNFTLPDAASAYTTTARGDREGPVPEWRRIRSGDESSGLDPWEVQRGSGAQRGAAQVMEVVSKNGHLSCKHP